MNDSSGRIEEWSKGFAAQARAWWGRVHLNAEDRLRWPGAGPGVI